ncbi:MAG: hypothetical protein ACYSR7_04950 [Planctomycetota bacterium]
MLSRKPSPHSRTRTQGRVDIGSWGPTSKASFATRRLKPSLDADYFGPDRESRQGRSAGPSRHKGLRSADHAQFGAAGLKREASGSATVRAGQASVGPQRTAEVG